MTKLTETQSALLQAAAATHDGTTLTPQDGKPAVAGLIKRGFFISMPQAEGPSRLLITEAGRQAITPTAEEAPEQTEPTAPELAEAAPPAKDSSGNVETPSPKPAKPASKLARVVELLRRPQGATLDILMEATGWQAHSVRGALSGSIKKGMGLEVLSEKIDGGRTYRIPPALAEGVSAEEAGA